MPRKIFAALVTAGLLGIGALVLQRWVAETKSAAIVLVAVWFVVVGGLLLVYARSRPELRPAILATLAVTVVGSVAIGWWTGFRDQKVSEDIVVATAMADETAQGQGQGGSGKGDSKPPKPDGPIELATGEFAGADGHAGTGVATTVELEDGSTVLTFSEFDVDPGARVEVWLTPGPDEVNDRVELGALSGNVGDQQYDVPKGTDLTRYDTVVLYCTPFTVRIAVAPLA